MNWSDLVVIAIIVGFGMIGLSKGFINSLFKIAAFFVSAFLAVQFYPLVAKILAKTVLYTNIQTSILKNLLMQKPGVDSQVKQAAANSVVDSLHLPGFLKGTIIDKMPTPSKLLPVNEIMNSLSNILAHVVINVISLVLLYIIIRIGLIFVRFLLQGVAKLPLFKQIDKLGGFAMGAVEGLLMVYILFTILVLFSATPSFKGVFAAVDQSVIAKFFYQHNFIMEWMSMKVV